VYFTVVRVEKVVILPKIAEWCGVEEI
jgi:hypothetical protein